MTHVGIDAICFYTPQHFLRHADLASARGIDPEKYHKGLGLYQMSVPTPDEDVVTMAASATQRLFNKVDKDDIHMILFATESSIDQSKSAGLYLHHLLKMNPRCRVLEIKQACYSATAAIRLATAHVEKYPKQKVLIVASDIPRYGLGTPGEPSHGAGAVAMAISVNPRTLHIEAEAGYHADEQMDFWRPNYRQEALVAGKLSCELYYHFLIQTWESYKMASGLGLNDIDQFCFHVPIPRLTEKALTKLLRHESDQAQHDMQECLQDSLVYARQTGNCYTASLYISLISILDHCQHAAGQRIGLYSYGSGSMGEFLSGVVMDGYQDALFTEAHQHMLSHRQVIDIPTYEQYYQFQMPTDGSQATIPTFHEGFRLSGMHEHKRLYQIANETA